MSNPASRASRTITLTKCVTATYLHDGERVGPSRCKCEFAGTNKGYRSSLQRHTDRVGIPVQLMRIASHTKKTRQRKHKRIW